jgi:hypothetical protein
MKAIENNEMEKERIFIAEEDSNSKDEEKNKGLKCLEHAEMKATYYYLIYDKEIQLEVEDG